MRATSSLLLALSLAGCSVVLDPGTLQGNGGVDAGDGGPSMDASPDASPDAAPSADAGDAGPRVDAGCPDGELECGGGCVDVSSSALHCGACGAACDPGQSCRAGSCRPAILDAFPVGGAGADAARGVALDAAGNAYVVVESSGDVDYGGGNLPGEGESDIGVVSYAPDGGFRWAVRFGGTGSDGARGVAFDPTAGVLVAGEFRGTVDFGTGPLASAGERDIVLLALDPATGTTRWARRYGGPGDESVLRAAVSPTRVMYVTGFYSSEFDFAGNTLVTGGDVDAFLLSLDVTVAGATERWSRTVAGTGRDIFESVTTDVSGNIVCAAGMFADTVVIGGGSPLTSMGGTDALVACFDATGGLRWREALGGAGEDQFGGVAIGSDFVTATGAYNGSVAVAGGTLTSAGGYDGVVATYELDGRVRWALGVASAGDFDFGLQTSVGPDDRVYSVGIFQAQVRVAGTDLPHAGGFDAFVGVFSAVDGELDWARMFGSPVDDTFTGSVVSPSGDALWLVGTLGGDIDYGAGNVEALGEGDGVVVRVAP